MEQLLTQVLGYGYLIAVAGAMFGVLIVETRKYLRSQPTRNRSARLESWATTLRGFNQADGRVAAADPWQHHRHRAGNPLGVSVWSLPGINLQRVWRAEWGGYTTTPRHSKAAG